MQTLSELRAIPHLSISKIKTFLQCPRQFFYRYIERVEPELRKALDSFKVLDAGP